MRGPASSPPGRLALYRSASHRCEYLPGRLACQVVVDPLAPMDAGRYSALARRGFRRSGDAVYRPACPACTACVPLRVRVARFRPSRSQRRSRARNADLTVSCLAPVHRREAFELYLAYLERRHPASPMNDPDPESYLGLLAGSWSRSFCAEFRLGGRLVAVAVTDVLDRALSAAYTFFDPHLPQRGLGTWSILWQIDEARRRGLDHLYLGYWVEGSRTMSYKARFRPAEVLTGEGWSELGVGAGG